MVVVVSNAGGQIADVNLSSEHVPRHGAADQGGGDVVEERRQDEHDDEQDQTALPVVRQERRHLVRHPAGLEMSRQQREAGEKQKQIGEDHPFVLQMQRQAGKTRAELEAGEGEFVAGDDRKTRERHIQRVMVEQRDSH